MYFGVWVWGVIKYLYDMIKDFSEWHNKKEFLHNAKTRPFFHEAEVWFCALGANIGFEQDGRGELFLRPVIVIKKFNQETFWGLPLTKHQKKGKYYFSFGLNNATSTAILSQIRLIDGKRLNYKIGNIAKDDFIEIKKRLAQLLA